MPNRKFLIAVGIAVALTAAAPNALRADENRRPMRLADEVSPSYPLYVKPTAAELRQARALEKHRQRVARMEANAWAGYSPLRPTVSANPFMQPRQSLVRPYHIWTPWDVVYGLRSEP